MLLTVAVYCPAISNIISLWWQYWNNICKWYQ